MDSVPDTFPALFWGYTIVWTILAFYIFSLVRKIARLEKSLNDKNEETDS